MTSGTIRDAVSGAILALACAALGETLVSLIDSNQWWIRVLDFPRWLSLIAIGVIALAGIVLARRWRPAILLVLAAATSAQFWRIYPYVPFAAVEVADNATTPGVDPASCFKVLGLNVLQHNRDYAATIATIDRKRPDVLLLMETDQPWAKALAPVLARYPHRLLRPIDNTYGLIFATTLPVDQARTENITDQNTPTVYARLRTRGGQPFDYIGLHPRPPIAGEDTNLRDRKIEHAALRIAGAKVPAMAMGDFNDVAWSRTTQLFKRVGGYLDPRIGRGSYPSFPAQYAAVGWPLDQLFVSKAFTFRSLRILANVGSDHRPLAADLCLAPVTAAAANTAAPDATAAARRAARRAARPPAAR